MDIGDNIAPIPGLMNKTFEGNLVNPVTAVKQLSYKFIQVKGDGSVIPVYEEDVIKSNSKNLSADVQTDQTFVDDAMFFHMEEADCFFAIGDVPCAIDNNVGKVDFNDLETANAHEGKQVQEYVDRTFGGAADEGTTLLLTSDHQDNLPGSTSARNLRPNSPLHYESQREDLSSKCEAQGLGNSLNTVKVSDSAVLELASDHKPMFRDDMSGRGLHDAFKSSFGQDTCVNDKEWLRHRILCGLQNFTDKDGFPGHFETEMPSQESEDSMILIPGNDLAKSVCCSLINTHDTEKLVVGRSVHPEGQLTGDAVVAAFCEVDRAGSGPVTKNTAVCGKRSRHQRFIEETLETDDKCRWRGSEMLSMVNQVVAAVVPRGRRVQRVCPNKNINFIMNDFGGGNKARVRPVDSVSAETSRSESCDDATYYASLDESSDDSIETFNVRKNGSRRKNHRQWTLTEITKLIDGVSKCGVGKWTDIKRLLFANSTYRTSVDLKDKWRNLLRASGVPMRSNKVKPQKNMNVPIPQSLLRRVKELANIHPYPRERKLDAYEDETSVSQSSKASN
ncbi:Myb domain-containing protein [Dioscorea alata]|uniref:Myb domain-containing protein n=1 Tax=Dioscorea alata TaxID=55571 RepID=A0ACB7UQ58_DIOAL|nr:Myb domain-containing protein [Dioscorea alata]